MNAEKQASIKNSTLSTDKAKENSFTFGKKEGEGTAKSLESNLNKQTTAEVKEDKVINKEQDPMKGTNESLERDPVSTAQMLKGA